MPTRPMTQSVLETGPYADWLWGYVLYKDAEGTYVFQMPLGPSGVMLLVSLNDVGKYARQIFKHPKRSAGLQLGVAIAHVTRAEHAAAFEAVTGKKARYEDTPLQAVLSRLPQGKIRARGSPGYDDPTLKTAAGHFGPWQGIFRDSGGNTRCWKRDYNLLDEIMLSMVRTLKEWMQKENYDRTPKQILKIGLSID